MDLKTKKIGFIGLGAMGQGMAANCARKGFDLLVHDLRREPVRELEALGARAASAPRDIGEQCDVILTVLPTGREVRQVLLEADGLFEHAALGTIFVDLSTIDPETTDLLHETATARGFHAIDAPIGRLSWHAERGECLFMVGGERSVFEDVRPLLDAMGTTIFYCGPGGSGTRTKLVNNYLAIISCQLNAEALALAKRFGLDLETTLEVIHGTTATNGQLKINWPDKVLSGDTEPGFTIDLAHKDLSLIVAAANAARVPVPVAAVAREAFSTARARGFGNQDFSAMADMLCDIAQIERVRLKG